MSSLNNHTSLSNSNPNNNNKNHLFLHFDVNETLIVEDLTGGDTKTDCMNKIISKSAYLTHDLLTFIDGTSIDLNESAYPVDVSGALHFEFKPPSQHVNSTPYYKAFKSISKRFTDHTHGLRFRPLLKTLNDALELDTGKLNATLSHDGVSHFLLPAFYETLNELNLQGRKFTVVFRTFGKDIDVVAKCINAFARGEHPLYPDFPEGLFNLTEDLMFSGRYNDHGEYILYNANSGDAVCSTDDEILSLMESSSIIAINDDYEYWSRNNCSPLCGKPLWLDENNKNTHHIFFDDNIHYDPNDSIVSIRKRNLGETKFAAQTGEGIMEEEGRFIVKVRTVEAILDTMYFLKKIEVCESERTKAREGEEK